MRQNSIRVLVLSVLVLSGLASACSAPASETGPRTAIIDQLYVLRPNPAFIDSAKQLLQNAGLKVDVYQGKEITVDFYRGLPQRGYQLIVFRAHAGILGVPTGSSMNVTEGTWLFTSEPYNQLKYPAEQMTKQMGMARIDTTQPWVFAVGAGFVNQSMKGQFNRTVIIMMGCSTLFRDDLAQAFIEKDASVYLGWTGTVDLNYVDEATLSLLQKLGSERLTVKDAVNQTVAEKGPDPTWGALLEYYPAERGSQAIGELTK